MATEAQADAIVAQILEAFAVCGHLDYGERVSMKEHMLQAAWFAEQDGGDDRLIVAALLHDYGHLICDMPNNTFSVGNDNYHETVGAAALREWFYGDIVNAVRLHVDAKRYLCAFSPGYVDKLSEASKVTLAVQGGPMTSAEVDEFRQQPGHELALRVRIYDDQGKVPNMMCPDLNHYAPKIRACLACNEGK